MRLNRYLAAAGVGSRRHCDELIAAGRVTINGQVCTNFSAQPGETDYVKIDRKLVRLALPETIMLHKPAGFVSTRSDPYARDTIFDLLPPKLSHLFNVGRLDTQSEGLLLITNDGALAQRLTHPRFKVEKEYDVFLDRPWNASLTIKLTQGILLDGQRARVEQVQSITPTRLRIVLRQGINRQIRRMFEVFDYQVKRLVRTRIGNLRLGDLPRGQWRGLTKQEFKQLAAPPAHYGLPSRSPGKRSLAAGRRGGPGSRHTAPKKASQKSPARNAAPRAAGQRSQNRRDNFKSTRR